jgi:hypothetical protein
MMGDEVYNNSRGSKCRQRNFKLDLDWQFENEGSFSKDGATDLQTVSSFREIQLS